MSLPTGESCLAETPEPIVAVRTAKRLEKQKREQLLETGDGPRTSYVQAIAPWTRSVMDDGHTRGGGTFYISLGKKYLTRSAVSKRPSDGEHKLQERCPPRRAVPRASCLPDHLSKLPLWRTARLRRPERIVSLLAMRQRDPEPILCPRCDSNKVRPSSRLKMVELILRVVCIQPFRCQECRDRFWAIVKPWEFRSR